MSDTPARSGDDGGPAMTYTPQIGDRVRTLVDVTGNPDRLYVKAGRIGTVGLILEDPPPLLAVVYIDPDDDPRHQDKRPSVSYEPHEIELVMRAVPS